MKLLYLKWIDSHPHVECRPVGLPHRIQDGSNHIVGPGPGAGNRHPLPQGYCEGCSGVSKLLESAMSRFGPKGNRGYDGYADPVIQSCRLNVEARINPFKFDGAGNMTAPTADVCP